MVDRANYVFLPWVRQGAAASIQMTDSLNAEQAGVVSVTVKLRVNEAEDIARQVRLYGPGDITGIDPQQVIRTEPRQLATDFEPNYFPAIEFDRPDFPWLFTPAKANTDGKLRPWLCLVVVRKQEGVTLHVARGGSLPELVIKPPAHWEDELPDLSESWAWAHAQVTGSLNEVDALRKTLAGDPALTVSRLLCPRRLEPATEYLACLVPTFELGRKAGRNEQITADDEKKLKPAWPPGSESPDEMTLPVYYHWEFRTGTGGDFEALVQLLEPRHMPEEVGKRLMDISQPGFKIDGMTPDMTPELELEGALRVRDTQPAEWQEEARKPFQESLLSILNAPGQAMKDGLKGDQEPLLAPPIYGSWQAAQHTVESTLEPPPSRSWLHELNLDPRYRVIAALGTKVVQAQQEQLMAAAWEQLGEVQRINQIRRQAQLGRAINAVYHAKHFTKFSEETLLRIVTPAQSRIVVKTADSPQIVTNAMLSHRISQSALPERAFSAPLRHLTSSRGAVSVRFQSVGAPPIAIVNRLNSPNPIVPFLKKPAGVTTINLVSDRAGVKGLEQEVRFEQVSSALNTPVQLSNFQISAEGDEVPLLVALTHPTLPPPSSPPPRDSADAQAFRLAATAHQDYLIEAFTLSEPQKQLSMEPMKDALLQSLNPNKTIEARVQASLILAQGAELRGDPLEPILDAPDFPQPMYEALRDLAQDFLFPGLEHVPSNTVTLLETNTKFVEAFLVGLNAEMSSELLWRNYPTDQRGTYFRHFWDTSIGDHQPDIAMIREWDNRLGDNTRIGEGLVLLLRGELLRRYPNSVIYAVKAEKVGGQLELTENECHPLYRGTLKPDVTFLGFPPNLTRDEAISVPGWFFVIQQQPTEPRFGMDAANFADPLTPLTSWNELSWRHMANTEEELKALSHASFKSKPEFPVINNVEWGKNAAHQAFITLQRPVRIAIHASEMIPAKVIPKE